MTNPIVPITDVTKAALEEAKGLFNKFLGPGLDEAGAIIGDQVRLYRLKREIKLLRKAERILGDAGLKPKVMNLRVMLPLLDAAVLEDDEEMAERWASLLASAADPNNNSTSEVSFIEILKQLAPPHAFLLDVFYEQIERAKRPPEEWSGHGVILSYLESSLKKEVPQFNVAVDNLLRLRLVEHPTAKLGVANGQDVRVQVMSSDILCATSLGMAFVSACGHGRTPRDMSYSVPENSVSNLFWTRGGSLKMSPSPPAKAIPPGIIPPDLKLRIEMEALEIAKGIGYVEPGVSLVGRTLRVDLGKKKLPQEASLQFVEFCAERGLQLETYQTWI